MSIENIKIPLDYTIPWFDLENVTNVNPAWTARLSNFDQIIREVASSWNTLTTPQVVQQTKNPDVQIPEQPTNPEEWMDLLK